MEKTSVYLSEVWDSVPKDFDLSIAMVNFVTKQITELNLSNAQIFH